MVLTIGMTDVVVPVRWSTSTVSNSPFRIGSISKIFVNIFERVDGSSEQRKENAS
ncbi:hypothetical protein D3C76_640800 [compost metagenome]